jgi:hypothetical protein
MKGKRIETRLKPDEVQKLIKLATKRKTSLSKVLRKLVIDHT